jgi:predicted RNase H-like HicB family nuclease
MKISYIFWKDGEFWLGYLEEYPDYMTQGTTMDELKENLKDLFNDLTSGEIPYVRKKGQLEVA